MSKRKPGVRTLCTACDKVVTSSNGIRLLNGNFDSQLPRKKMTADTVYCYCDECYKIARELSYAQV